VTFMIVGLVVVPDCVCLRNQLLRLGAPLRLRCCCTQLVEFQFALMVHCHHFNRAAWNADAV